jgi:bifunctional NMN adenylyltransferase/nudix hydrolase
MTHRDYSAAVLIGRFQPIHNEHKSLIEHALEIADKVVILVGSAHAAPTPKNPFTFEERRDMIRSVWPRYSADKAAFYAPGGDFSGTSTERVLARAENLNGDGNRLIIEPIRDYFYSDDTWLAQVQSVVSNYIEDGETVSLMGNYKDRSSYYLNFFPQWEFVHPKVKSQMDATAIREVLFDVKIGRKWSDTMVNGESTISADARAAQNDFFKKSVPDPVLRFLTEFRSTERFANLSEEFKANRSYRESWDVAPFPPTFITADAIVTCGGHVLVIKRGFNPGKGLLALPGGFVRPHERIKDAAVRELKEETRIRIDKPVLKRAIVDSEVFDYPDRSERGRTVTHAFHIKLDGKLPEVKATGADDAVKCVWMPYVEVMRRADEFFEDHIHIINNFITA